MLRVINDLALCLGQGVMEYEDDVFVPTIDGESDDEETINKEELCAEKV
jgi:hypothetical protein